MRFIRTLRETKCYYTLFASRINMECTSSCISHFFAVRPKCLKLPCRQMRGFSAVPAEALGDAVEMRSDGCPNTLQIDLVVLGGQRAYQRDVQLLDAS